MIPFLKNQKISNILRRFYFSIRFFPFSKILVVLLFRKKFWFWEMMISSPDLDHRACTASRIRKGSLEEIQFSYGNLVRLSLEAEGSEKSLPFLPRFALMDVTMASKSSPAISPPSTLVHRDGKTWHGLFFNEKGLVWLQYYMSLDRLCKRYHLHFYACAVFEVCHTFQFAQYAMPYCASNSSIQRL